MSTKSSLFITRDNEHCYYEQTDRVKIDGQEWWSIYLEMDKDNIEILTNDSTDLIVKIKPNTELYEMIERMDDRKANKVIRVRVEPIEKPPVRMIDPGSELAEWMMKHPHRKWILLPLFILAALIAIVLITIS